MPSSYVCTEKTLTVFELNDSGDVSQAYLYMHYEEQKGDFAAQMYSQ